MSTSHEMEDEAPPRDCRLRSRADGHGGAVTCQDTQQQSESQANHPLPCPSAHFFVLTGARSGARTSALAGARARGCTDVSDGGVVIGRGSGDTPSGTTFDDPRMSRAHARLARGPSGWQLLDLQSRNGSAVNGVRVEPQGRAELPDGAVIRMGDTLLVFREGPAPAEEPPLPAGLGAGLAGIVGDAERGAFPGISGAAHVIRRRIARLAVRTGHVLVLGETGTGKERVARAMAPHSKMPFEVQNCAELQRELARSELFGHLRGAFTGAHNNRTGLVELAGDGVLFLDELGELPLEVQGELLRFLEDGMFRPVGSMELRKSRARIVAATNVDLDEAVRRGTFRRDLLARLRASNEPLQLPPLRHRREDVLDWTRAFALELRGGAPGAAEPTPDRPPSPLPGQLPDPLWTASALECLLLYPWPENLRELRGVVRELCDAHPEGAIRAEDLPERVRAHREQLRARSQQPSPGQQASAIARPTDASPAAAGWPPALPVSEPSEEEIKRVLKEHKGNVRMCAELLSMERTKLYRRCGKLGIDIEQYRDP